jgi:hypothetical protein
VVVGFEMIPGQSSVCYNYVPETEQWLLEVLKTEQWLLEVLKTEQWLFFI